MDPAEEVLRGAGELQALGVLQSRLVNGQIVVERVHRSLAALEFCRKGQPSELATAR